MHIRAHVDYPRFTEKKHQEREPKKYFSDLEKLYDIM